MAYENALRVTYSYGAVGIGAGTVIKTFRTPKGKRGRVLYANAGATTALVGTTTPGKMQLGDGTTANKYLDLFLGSAGTPLAVNTSAAASDLASGIVSQAASGYLYLDADTLYTLTFLQPVGTPAGVVDAQLVVEYF